ncbi:TasA family protein [Chloroflexota bacterium]
MKKILGLTVAAVLVIGLVGGGTWAYFSDTEETTGNIFSAGTLDLGVANAAGTNPTGSTTATFAASDLYPGSTAGSGTLYVNNEGSINMSSVEISFSLAGYTENTPNTVDNWDLTTGTDNLTNMIIATDVKWDGTDVAALENKSIEELIAMAPYDLGNLDEDSELTLYIEWTFSATATNGCQGDSVDLTISLEGNQ